MFVGLCSVNLRGGDDLANCDDLAGRNVGSFGNGDDATRVGPLVPPRQLGRASSSPRFTTPRSHAREGEEGECDARDDSRG